MISEYEEGGKVEEEEEGRGWPMVGPWAYLSNVCYILRESVGFIERNTFIRREMDRICVPERTPIFLKD